MNRVPRWSPLAQVPGTLKGGDTSEMVNIFVAVEGGPFGKKTNFQKKSHNAEKQKGGPFGVFQHPFCRKTAKQLKGDFT